MRISDWSSDVCSSDLAVIAAPITTPGKTRPDGLLIGCDLLCISTGRAPAAALIVHAGGTVSYDEQAHGFVLRSMPEGMQAAGALNGAWQQIGRASCRERGCQYV